MCKVANNNIMSYATNRLEQISKGKYYIYKSSATDRCIGKSICVPLCCSPCILWSCTFRILCIPFKGCNAVGGVESTQCCDTCIIHLCDEYDKEIPEWANHDIKNTSQEDLEEIIIKTMDKITQCGANNRTVLHLMTFITPIYNEYCTKTMKEAKVLLISCLYIQLKDVVSA